jgi:cell division septum initiation protein DivIVA
MTSNSDVRSGSEQEDAFEVQMRGYSRRQVDEFVARSRSQIRDLEDRLSRSLDESERLRLELSTVRQGLNDKPAHEEISERVGQILKLADDEAKAQRTRAQDDITKQREEAKNEADRARREARDQTERMLTAAQEQAENAIATARAEAEKMRNTARAESERTTRDAAKKAEATLATAKAQTKQLLDEATTRATAIHDGAERRLNLLTSRHTETMRRLTEIRDVVTNLVSSETARGSLEEEVAKSVATSSGAGGSPSAGRPAGAAENRHSPPQMPGRAGARDSAAATRPTPDREQRSAPAAARPATAQSGQHAARATTGTGAEERASAPAKATRPAQEGSGPRESTPPE